MRVCKIISSVLIQFGLLGVFAFSGGGAQTLEEPIAAAAPQSPAVPAIFLKYADFKWDRILPDLGTDLTGDIYSPQ